MAVVVLQDMAHLQGVGVAGGLLRGVASWSRWVASSRRIGHLQQKAGRQALLYRLTATTVKDHQKLPKNNIMNLQLDLVCTS